jgi:mono/diheme cytochrome c family protein
LSKRYFFQISAVAFLAGLVAVGSVWAQGAPLVEAPDKGDAYLENGKKLFTKATCVGCHPRGENSLNGDRPLKGAAFLKRYQNPKAFIDFVRQGSPERGMPKFPASKLSDEELKNILAYVRTFTH